MLPRPDEHRVLALMHGQLRDGGVAGLIHGVDEQMVRFAAGVFGNQVIRAVEVERVDLVHLDELEDLHAVGRLRLDLLDLRVLHEDILVFDVLVPLDNLGALDRAVTRRAVQLLAHARVTRAVQLVEAHPFAARRGEQAHRDRDQAKGDIALPDSGGHGTSPSIHSSPSVETVRGAAVGARYPPTILDQTCKYLQPLEIRGWIWLAGQRQPSHSRPAGELALSLKRVQRTNPTLCGR